MINIPKTFAGKTPEQMKEDYERVMNRKEESRQAAPSAQPVQDKDSFIYVPSINLWIAKEKSLLGKSWSDCQANGMLTIPEFIKFLKYTEVNYSNIYEEITAARDPCRAEWIDAYFEQRMDGMYILTKNRTVAEKLDENTLMEEKNIDLEDWLINSHTNQGLPTKEVKTGSLSYWHPRDERVVRFSADFERDFLICSGGSTTSAFPSLGVRAVD